MIEQSGDRFPVDPEVPHQRSPPSGNPIHPTVSLVAIGVSDVGLHVTDDDVLPIRYVECSIVPDFKVCGPEITILFGNKEILDLRALNIAVFIGCEGVLLDAQETDGIADEEVSVGQ